MSSKVFKGIFAFVSFLILALRISSPAAAPNPQTAVFKFLTQAARATVPNFNSGFFKFLNPEGDPIAIQLGLRDTSAGIPVELDPGESAFVTLGWFMFSIDKCEHQTVRQVVDFETEDCRVPHPDQADPDTILETIAALPDHCLGEAASDPCGTFEEFLRFDFGTSIAKTRRILSDEITQGFTLNGDPVTKVFQTTQFFKYVLGGGNPDNAPSLVCADELYYSPIYAYNEYGYQIPPQTGKCIAKVTGAMLTPLDPGEYELEFLSTLGGEPIPFPTLKIIQH